MAPPATETTAAAEQALARSTLYRFLSLAWSPPEDGLDDLRAAPAVLAEVSSAAARVGVAEARERVERIAAALVGSDPSSVQVEYRRLFGHQISRDCPLHETQYGAGHVFQQAQQLADIAGFYLAFGLEVAEGAGERVDHLSLELEFLHTLAFREAHARIHHGAEEVSRAVEGQQAFLRDHLGRWVPAFSRLVEAKDDGIYRELAYITRTVVAADAISLGIAAGDEVDLAPPVSLDPDDATLPCGADRCPLEPSP